MHEQHPFESNDDQYLLKFGYRPQLKRRLTAFSSFAIPFSLMSVLVGVFGTYSFVLQTAGPFGIWTWVVVAAGQFLIALVFAELAGRIPLTGSIYHWNKQLGGVKSSWLAGWIMVFASSVGGVAAAVALMPPLESLLGISLDPAQVKVLGVFLILLQLAINVYGIKLAGEINRYAVLIEIICLLVTGIAVAVAATISGTIHFGPIVHHSISGQYWSQFAQASLLGIFTLIGFESASDVSEETVNARQVTPKSILRSVAVSATLGFAFLLILTVAIPNVARITASSDPVSDIVTFYFGTVAAKVVLACVVFAIFAASELIVMYVSRLAFAVARDGRIVGAKYLSYVSDRGIPLWSAVLVAVIELVIFMFAADQTAIFAANSVLFCIGYLITLVNFARSGPNLPDGSFSLGKLRPYVVFSAIMWVLAEIALLTIPTSFHSAAVVAIVVILAGFGLQFVLGRQPSAK